MYLVILYFSVYKITKNYYCVGEIRDKEVSKILGSGGQRYMSDREKERALYKGNNMSGKEI